jgi:hypothetical protein
MYVRQKLQKRMFGANRPDYESAKKPHKFRIAAQPCAPEDHKNRWRITIPSPRLTTSPQLHRPGRLKQADGPHSSTQNARF